MMSGIETPYSSAVHWKVGRSILTTLSDGYFQMPMEQFLTGIPAAEIKRTQHIAMRETNERININAYLIRSAGHVSILVDAGLGSGMVPSAGRLLEALRSVGVSPDEIGTILLTHLHGDHCRGLVDESGNAIYPNAEIVISAAEDMLVSLGDGTRDEKQLHDFMLAFYNRWLPVLDIPVPVIVAMQGDCIGVAPVFACAADIAVADETLNLQVTFASLGFYPGMALPGLLKRRIGPYNALRLCVANEAIDGKEAERLGLIDKCLPAGAAFEYALQVARQIALSAPSVVRPLKKNLGIDKTELTAELEANAMQQAKDFHTDEYRRRIANYLPNHYA